MHAPPFAEIGSEVMRWLDAGAPAALIGLVAGVLVGWWIERRKR